MSIVLVELLILNIVYPLPNLITVFKNPGMSYKMFLKEIVLKINPLEWSVASEDYHLLIFRSEC